MEASETHLARAARGGSAREQADRAAHCSPIPTSYRTWETEHARHMDDDRQPADRRARRRRSLLSTAFSLVHRTALFEYLRAASRRASAGRDLLIQHFHGNKSYSQAMVAEHGNYQRSFASLLCVEHIGDDARWCTRRSAIRSAATSICTPSISAATATASWRRPARTTTAATACACCCPYLKRDVLDVRARLLAMPSTADAGAHATR